MTLIDVDEKKVRRYTTEAFEEKKQERMDSEAKQIVERVTQKLEAHQFQKDIEDLRLSVASRSDTGGNSSFITPRSTITHSPVSTPGPILPQVGSDIPDEALYGAGHPSMDEEREITGKIIFHWFVPQSFASQCACRYGCAIRIHQANDSSRFALTPDFAQSSAAAKLACFAALESISHRSFA